MFKREGRASKKAFKTRVNHHFKEDPKPAETNTVNVKLSPEYTMKDASLQTKASPGSEQEVLLKPSQIESVKPMFHHDNLSKINQINNLINQATAYSGNKIQQMMMPPTGVVMNNNQILPQNMIYTGLLNNHHQIPQGFNMANMGPSVNSTENLLQNLIGLNHNLSIDNSRFRVIPVSSFQGGNNMNLNPVFVNMNMPNMQQQQQPVKYAIIQPPVQQQQPQMIRVYPQINQMNNINTNLYQSTLNYF